LKNTCFFDSLFFMAIPFDLWLQFFLNNYKL